MGALIDTMGLVAIVVTAVCIWKLAFGGRAAVRKPPDQEDKP